ncbi:MAG: tetratricopeptide repeat protein [Candidatus Latescibacterota bacterium]|nr:MAG: tetratricopeptide repeat protein [Candidatus Latescibacterota bacterium]
MPLDSEKKRLEARLLDLLQRALEERNRTGIVSTSLELGALYVSGDLYDKAEESFRRVLEEPGSRLARAEERAQAEVGFAQVTLRRGHLTLAREALERAEKHLTGPHEVLLDVRNVQCERDLHAGLYRDVVDSIEATLARETAETLGDARIDFMVLEGRARHLLGRNRQAQRLLEKALELAQSSGYEPGSANARSELGALMTTIGQFKLALEHLEEAVRSGEGMGSQYRLDRDRRRLAWLFLRMGRWEDGESLLRRSYESSRDLRTLENRLGSQLGRAQLLALRGVLEEAGDIALDAMEVARAAGYVRRQVQGLLLLGGIAFDAGELDEALESLKQAEAVYAPIAPESSLMVQIQAAIGRVLDARKESAEAFERLMRALNLARETGNVYERHRIDSYLGVHFGREGEQEKAAGVLSQAASELGGLGAKYDVAVTRLWFAQLLANRRPMAAADRQREMKLARSNLFEARRLFEPMGAEPRLAEVREAEAKVHQEPAPSSENAAES